MITFTLEHLNTIKACLQANGFENITPEGEGIISARSAFRGDEFPCDFTLKSQDESLFVVISSPECEDCAIYSKERWNGFAAYEDGGPFSDEYGEWAYDRAADFFDCVERVLSSSLLL